MKVSLALLAHACFGTAIFVPTTILAFSQATLEFEVASVKVTDPNAPRMRAGMTPGTLTLVGQRPRDLIVRAWNLRSDQLSGPTWLDSDRYTIVAKFQTAATRAQVNEMLRELLAKRFGLEVHREFTQLPREVLTVGKGGPRLHVSKPQGSSPPTGEHPQFATGGRSGADGFPEPLPPNGLPEVSIYISNGKCKIVARQASMGLLAEYLSMVLPTEVIDETGLNQQYDFTVYYSQETLSPDDGVTSGRGDTDHAGFGDMAASTPSGPNLRDALRTELGIKMERRAVSVEVLMVDHLNKHPIEN